MTAPSYRIWDIIDSRLIKNGWKFAPLGQLLTKSNELAEIDPTQTYKEITVRLWGKGVALRGEKAGNEIGATKRFLVHKGQFIYSRIDARNGAFGLIPEELEGAVVSTDFPVHYTKERLLLPTYLGWMSRVPLFVDACRTVSEGTTNRVRLKEEKFYKIEIPLPPLSEQRRIVAKIDRLSAKVEEAIRLRDRAKDLENNLKIAVLRSLFSSLRTTHTEIPLGELIEMSSGMNLTKRRMNDGFPYAVYGGGGLAGRYSEYMFEESKIGIGRVGARCGCVFLTEPKSWITDNALVVSSFSSSLDIGYLLLALTNLNIRQFANQAAQPVVSQKKIKPQKIPVPPLEGQRRIVDHINDFQAKIDDLKSLRTKTAAELDAMLPSILDKAFKGEI